MAKKEPKPGPEDLTKMLAKIQKSMKGAAKIVDIAEATAPYAIRRPTGIMSMDDAMAGGFPAGTICQVFGPDGVGKDYLLNLVIAQNQQLYGDNANSFWMSFGYKPDRSFMRMAGVQIAKTDEELLREGITPSEATPEQRGVTVGNIVVIDIVAAIKAAVEQPAETLLTAVLKLISSNKFQIGIINELGSGETGDNVKKELGENVKMATFASLMSDFCRKYYTAMRIPSDDGRDNETTILAINPVRANVDAMSAKFIKFTQGSGHALKHAKVIDMHLEPRGYIKQGTTKVGKKIKWKISKGKHGVSEGAEGEFHFIFNHGVDLVPDLVNVAKARGLIRNRGQYTYILDYEDRITGGILGALALVRESPELQDELRETILAGASNGEPVDIGGPEEEAQED